MSRGLFVEKVYLNPRSKMRVQGSHRPAEGVRGASSPLIGRKPGEITSQPVPE